MADPTGFWKTVGSKRELIFPSSHTILEGEVNIF
jgi:hypothetical protein